ncbi:MAG TPA: response regulator transcription factor [Nevskiaceae bacterium]|nr:response regulator transcription factor [Nevskiaceae bacterium]
MTQHIAVVDDDARLRDLVVGYLNGQGLAATGFDGGGSLRAAMRSQSFDLVVLDMMMPGEDGLSVLRWLRAGSHVPVIMLTAADGMTDRVLGLELGADDYVTKPADLRELLARIRSNLRRSAMAPAAAPGGGHANATKPAAPREAWFGRWRLDRARRRLVDADQQPLELTGHEFALLTVFADHPNVVLSREKLLELSGTDATEVFDRAIDMRITRLRKKIEPVPGVSTVIRTVRGHGGGYEYVPSDGPSYGT